MAGVGELACLDHPRLVNAAYFSPQSGSKLMSTCIDNRVRVWDYLHSIDKPCDREIVHSHDFNRYLTPFRAEWDPKDPHERLLVVGRCDWALCALHWLFDTARHACQGLHCLHLSHSVAAGVQDTTSWCCSYSILNKLAELVHSCRNQCSCLRIAVVDICD